MIPYKIIYFSSVKKKESKYRKCYYQQIILFVSMCVHVQINLLLPTTWKFLKWKEKYFEFLFLKNENTSHAILRAVRYCQRLTLKKRRNSCIMARMCIDIVILFVTYQKLIRLRLRYYAVRLIIHPLICWLCRSSFVVRILKSVNLSGITYDQIQK